VKGVDPAASDSRCRLVTGRLVCSLGEFSVSYWNQLRRCRYQLTDRSAHQLRGKARRMLAGIKLLDGILSKSVIRKAKAALKKQYRALGELRDVQEQLRYLRSRRPLVESLRPFRHHLQKRKRRLNRHARHIFKKAKPAKWIERAEKRLKSVPSDARSIQRLRASLNRLLRSALKSAVNLLPIRTVDLGRLHRSRIAIKRYCDMVELLQPANLILMSAMIVKLRGLKKLIGKVHDHQLFMVRLEKWAANRNRSGRKTQAACVALARRGPALLAAYFRSVRPAVHAFSST
jgi:CHAD domain-containing protein